MFFCIIIKSSIKKFTKISLIVLLTIFTVSGTTLLFLQNKKVQTILTHYITEAFGKELNTNISIDNISITFFNRFLISDLYLEDQSGDTLLYSKKVKLIFSKFNRSKNIAIVKRLELNDANIFIEKDSSNVNNLKFLIDALKNPEKKAQGERLNLSFEAISIKNSILNITAPPKRALKSDINLFNLKLLDFNTSINKLTISGDTVFFKVKNLNFVEESGFKVQNLRAEMSISKNHINYSNVFLKTQYSDISANSISMNFNIFKDFSNFIENINMKFNFRSSYIGFQDLGYFSSHFKNIDERLLLSGLVSGTINDLSGKKILIAIKDYSGFMGNFNIIGLPNIDETFMHFDIDNFQTHLDDIEDLQLKNDLKISIPKVFKEVGAINYSGKFTGYLDDFVAYGILETDLGKVSTDILLTPGNSGALSFEGIIKTQSLEIDKLIKEKDILGNLSMSAIVDGTMQKGNISANLSGIIDSLEFYNYNYQNINLSGQLTERKFDGSFDIMDPNIKLDFNGKVDFSNDIPIFDFTADVSRLRPYYLNINKSDPSYFASFLLSSNFSGIDPDDINGEITLVNSFFQRSEEQLQIYDFSLKMINSIDSSGIKIRSDIFDADMNGHYRISTLAESFKDLSTYFIPSLQQDSSLIKTEGIQNSFEYEVHLKSINPVIQFFTRDFEIGNHAYISGNYNSQSYSSYFNAKFPMAGMKDKYWKNIEIVVESDSINSNLNAAIDNFRFNDDLALENIRFDSQLKNDSLSSSLTWINNDLANYEGDIDVFTIFSNNLQSNNLVLDINLFPSYFIFNDTLWDIPQSKIIIDSTSIRIDSFTIKNHSQNFLVHGAITENNEDKLELNVENFQIASLSTISKSTNLNFSGFATGVTSLSSSYTQALFNTDLTINSLTINSEEMGDAKLAASWNNSDKNIQILANSIKGTNEIFHLEGYYHPLNKKVNLRLDFDKLQLSTFSPLATKIVSDMKGLGTGNLRLTGELDNPELNGEIKFFKTSLLVNYLQTNYSFTDKIRITHNNLFFDDFELTDDLGHVGLLNGIVTNRNLKDFNLNLKFETENFSFLNTNEFDNQMFYGKVFAGGIINITGPPNNLFIDINARSQRNSVFFIPLFGAEEVDESDFLHFVNHNTELEESTNTKSEYEVNLQGLNLDFNLEVTPDAEVQLIFDPKVGDILRGRGNGNLNLSISTLGKFQIYGDMVIEEGDYLFTLQNVINKRFKVNPGGTIVWNGDPSDATIDLGAIYSLRTSVYELSPEPQEELKKRIPVECHILMTDKLMNPKIKTDIVLPTADQETKNIVSNSINTEEELTKQFLALLIINSFYTQTSDGQAGEYNAANVAGVAASELFSNQLSNWLSQISNDFDLGLNYRKGDEISSNELEVALSTQILNDRISINGNLDVATNQTNSTTNTNNIVGDFDIDFKLTDNGKLHLKAFNRANDNLLYETSPYTQGVGIFYREDFSTLGELMKRYGDAIRRLFTKKERKA